MPIFAHIETEAEVQLDDRTRLDASKTHVTANQPALTKLWVQPGADAVPVSVKQSKALMQYLDWEFGTWNCDIDASNDKIDFAEGTNIIESTLTHGTYTLAALATEIAAQMTSDSVLAQTYTGAVSIDDEMTLSSTGGFDLLLASGDNRLVTILSKLGFGSADLTGKQEYTSARVEYLPKKVTTYAGENKKQSQKVTCIGDTAGSLNSTYFIISATGDVVRYYVWFDVGGGGVDPAPAGLVGVPVVVAANDTAATVAGLVAAELDALAEFAASAVGADVTINHATADWNTTAYDSSDAPTGFTFTLLSAGEKQDSESTWINVYSVIGDHLFSDDSDLSQFEPDIRKWIVDGRNTYINIHRQAQKHILEWLDREGYVDIYRQKYTKWAIVDVSEVREWSRFAVLRMIFDGIKNSSDDLFQQKRDSYESREIDARKRAILRLDTDKSGDLYLDEGVDTSCIKLGFR